MVHQTLFLLYIEIQDYFCLICPNFNIISMQTEFGASAALTTKLVALSSVARTICFLFMSCSIVVMRFGAYRAFWDLLKAQ
jgi:hypothetical protein